MDKIVSEHPWIGWLLAAAAVATALGVLWRKVVRPAWRRGVLPVIDGLRRLARAADKMVDDLRGVPAEGGRPAVPGLADRMDSVQATLHEHGTLLEQLCQRVADVEHEMKPNSGHSLRDAVDRVEQAITDQAGA